MKIVILCPGPSMDKTYVPDHDQFTIGINRAVISHQCDVWACLDWEQVGDTHQMPLKRELSDCEWAATWSMTLLTQKEVANRIHGGVKGYDYRGPVVTYDSTRLHEYCPMPLMFWNLSSCLALVYAGRMAERFCRNEIHVYGYDGKGTADYDGLEHPVGRDANRWGREYNRWAYALVPWLRTRGVQVIRHNPEGVYRWPSERPEGLVIE